MRRSRSLPGRLGVSFGRARFGVRRHRGSFFARQPELVEPVAERRVTQMTTGFGQALAVLLDGGIVVRGHQRLDLLAGRCVHAGYPPAAVGLGRHVAAFPKTPRQVAHEGNTHRKARGNLALAAFAPLPRAEYPPAQVQRITFCHPAKLPPAAWLNQSRIALGMDAGKTAMRSPS